MIGLPKSSLVLGIVLLTQACLASCFSHGFLPSSLSQKRFAKIDKLAQVVVSQNHLVIHYDERRSSVVLRADSSTGADDGISDTFSTQLDIEAVVKYVVAAVVQLSCFTGAFYVLDLILDSMKMTGSVPIPLVAFLFYACSLRSRVFNPLNNERPNISKAVKGSEEGSKGFGDRVMPSWTPPGVVFPIMWILIIGPIRAYSSSLIVEANSGLFCTPATMAFILHLTIGDVWNTVNNTEKRYGAAVVGVLTVVLSVFFAASQYYQVLPFAGQMLGATAIWLVTASALIADTWRLNPDKDGNRDALYPTKESGTDASITTFSWFNSNKSD